MNWPAGLYNSHFVRLLIPPVAGSVIKYKTKQLGVGSDLRPCRVPVSDWRMYTGSSQFPVVPWRSTAGPQNYKYSQFLNRQICVGKHFPKSHATHNIYHHTHQPITSKKRSMTAPPVSMTARKARHHRNSISNNQFSSRPLGHKKAKTNVGFASLAVPSRLCVKKQTTRAHNVSTTVCKNLAKIST